MAILSRRQFSVVDQAGNIMAGASVEVRQELVVGQPLATLYADRAGATPLANPFTADSNGFAFFHVAGGVYRVRAYVGPSGAPTFEQIWDYVPAGNIDELDYSTDGALAANSDTLLPTQKAVKTYADAVVDGHNAGAFTTLTASVSFTLTNNQNAGTFARVVNTSTGTAAVAAFASANANGSTGFGVGGQNVSTALIQNRGYIAAQAALSGIAIYNEGANPIVFGVNSAEVGRFSGSVSGQFVVGLAGTLTGSVAFSGSTSGATVLQPAAAASGTLSLPAATDTLVGRATTDTLTNKSINASSNTITNLTTAMFAANVVDTDGALSANSDTRLASQKAVKTYVDTVAQGLDTKASVKAATTANITLSGTQTVDGVALVANDRCLVKNQTTTANNGIYVVASGAWTRAVDFDAWSEIPGAYTFVEQGTINGDTGWVCIADQGGTLGSTAVTFSQFSGAGTYTAGSGLTLSGTQFAIDTAIVTTLTGSQTLTNKTLTSPAINTPTIAGGTHTALTALGIRSTGSGAFDLTLTNTENLTAGRTLTLKVNDAARTIDMAGNFTLAGSFTTSGANALTLTTTGATNVTLPTTGTLVARASTDTLQNKTLDNTNAITVKDASLTLQDDGDTTKQAQFQLSGIATATTRTYALPNANTTLVGHDATQTLSNKTLDATNVGTTATLGDNSTKIATTAFVANAVAAATAGVASLGGQTGNILLDASLGMVGSTLTNRRAKNYIVNGAMQISQENAANAGSSNNYYAVDQFVMVASNAGTATAQQVASATPGGSPNRLRLTCTAADASVGAGDNLYIAQRLEGLRIAELRFGSASAKTLTLQFGVKAPQGTYCVAIWNGAAGTRMYIAEYTISAGEANTDVVKSVTIPGDTSGTWAVDNSHAMTVYFALTAGSNFTAGAGSWASSGCFATPNQFNFMGTNGNVFELFDVGLYEGLTAPAFQVPDMPAELLLCQRYFAQVGGAIAPLAAGFAYSTVLTFHYLPFKVQMRVAPSFAAAGSASDYSVYRAGANNAIDTLPTMDSANVAGAHIRLTHSTGPFTAGQGCMAYAFTTNAMLRFNARM